MVMARAGVVNWRISFRKKNNVPCSLWHVFHPMGIKLRRFGALIFGKWGGKLMRSKYLAVLGVAPKSDEVL